MANFSNLGTKVWLKYQSKWHYYSQHSLGGPLVTVLVEILQVRNSVLLEFLPCIVLLLDFKGSQMIELSKVIITLLMSSCFRKFWSILGSNRTSYRHDLQNSLESLFDLSPETLHHSQQWLAFTCMYLQFETRNSQPQMKKLICNQRNSNHLRSALWNPVGQI